MQTQRGLPPICPWKKSSLTFFHLENLRLLECEALATASCGRADTLSTARLCPAQGLVDERIEAAEPPTAAKLANRVHVGIGIVGEEFHDVGTRLGAARVQLERDEVR